jgi:hypothetical protein
MHRFQLDFHIRINTILEQELEEVLKRKRTVEHVLKRKRTVEHVLKRKRTVEHVLNSE